MPGEAVGIFIKARFPRSVRMGKEEPDVEGLGDNLVVSKFLTVVQGQYAERVAEWIEQANHRRGKQVRTPALHLG